jgi:phage major head subunit gpT-like protein
MPASPLTPALLQAFFVQLELRFQAAYARRTSYWKMFAELCPSGTETNIYSWLAELPDMREWVGEKKALNLKARAYSLLNKNWENTLVIDRNKLQDDQAGVYSRYPELQADVADRWPEKLVTDALIAGTTALGYDGVAFFSASHPVDVDNASYGTYPNLYTSTPLTQANYNALKADMRSRRGESGLPLQVKPTVLMVGPTLEQTGKQIVQAETIAQVFGSNTAAAAPTNVFKGDTTLIVNERLVDDTANAWYLFSTDRIKPMVFQEREAAHLIPIVDPSNPLVFNQRKWAFSLEGRGAAGYAQPFLASKATP